MAKNLEKCPLCWHKLEEKKVEKLLRGGGNTAVLNISALVCLHCGERLYDQKVVKQFDEVRNKLKNQQTESFNPIGKTFEVSLRY